MEPARVPSSTPREYADAVSPRYSFGRCQSGFPQGFGSAAAPRSRSVVASTSIGRQPSPCQILPPVPARARVERSATSPCAGLRVSQCLSASIGVVSVGRAVCPPLLLTHRAGATCHPRSSSPPKDSCCYYVGDVAACRLESPHLPVASRRASAPSQSTAQP